MKKFSLSTENIRSLRTLALAQGRGMQFVRPLAFGDVPDVLWEELHISGMACWRESTPILGEGFDGNDSDAFGCQSLQRQLVRTLSSGIERLVFQTFKAAETKFIPTSPMQGRFNPSRLAETRSRPTPITSQHLKSLTAHLECSLHAAPYDGGCYMGLASTPMLRNLKRETTFENWRRYLDPGMTFFGGEAGMVGNTRLVSVAHREHLDFGEMVVFGDDPIGMLEREAPTLTAFPLLNSVLRSWRWTGLLGFAELVSAPSVGSPVIVVSGGLWN